MYRIFSYILVATFFASGFQACISGATTALVLEKVGDNKNIKTDMAYFVASLTGYCIGLVSAQFLSYKYMLGYCVCSLYALKYTRHCKFKDGYLHAHTYHDKDVFHAFNAHHLA